MNDVANKNSQNVLASPKARKFARELGVDVKDVSGSERLGRVIEKDIKEFISSKINKKENIKIAGKTIHTSWINSDGDEKSVRYRVPNVNQCQECHESNKKVIPIGPKARNLNFNIYYSDIEKELNQLQYWFRMGLIDLWFLVNDY